jgi:Phosphotransferase enzyme family
MMLGQSNVAPPTPSGTSNRGCPKIDLSNYDLSKHPAVRAWSALDGKPAQPRSIQILKFPRGEFDKACTFRITGIGPARSSLIAKLSVTPTARLECLIYSDILPRLPVSRLEFYGTIPSEVEGLDWVFIEDAGENKYTRDDPADRRLATEWIAALHSSAANLPEIEMLPDRGPDCYLEHLRSARRRIAASHFNPALAPEQRAVLDRADSYLQSYEASWNELERLCQSMPRTLVHGDLARRNTRIHVNANARDLVGFDWEMAGRGVPAPDLASSLIRTFPSCLSTYFLCVREAWPALNFEDILRMAAVGRILRVIAAIDWASASLIFEEPLFLLKPVSYIGSYIRRIEDEIADPPWTTSRDSRPSASSEQPRRGNDNHARE